MVRNYLLLACFGLASLCADAVQTTPQLVKTIECTYTGVAVDKDNNYYPIVEKIEGNDATFIIYDVTLNMEKKQFTLKNLYDDFGDKGIYYANYISEFGQSGGSSVMATQAVYCDDDKWEVIVYTRNGERYEVKVVNEDGVVVADLGTFEGVSQLELDTQIYYNGSVFYEVHEYGEDMRFYRYTSGSSSVPVITTIGGGSRAYPNPLPSGQTLTVEFENAADSNTVVEVFDVTGLKVASVKAVEGQNKVQIPSRRLRSGNFVYVVTRNGQIKERGKIIAR